MTVIDSKHINLPIVALLLANLVPIAGVLYMDWDVGAIIVLYWTENLIAGGYTIFKMLLAGGKGMPFHMVLFCIHYGFFAPSTDSPCWN